MATKLQFEVVADRVDIRELWRSLTKDKIKVLKKAAPGLVKEAEFLGGGGGGEVGIGSVVFVSFGHDVPGVEDFTEKIVEFDETRRLISFLCLEGGFLKLGFAHYVITIKLDEVGEGKAMISTTLAYDLDQNADGTLALDRILKVLRHYIDSVVSYLQKNKA